MRQNLIACSCLILTATLVGSAEGPGSALTSVTDLVVEPDGQRVAVLLPGAAVHVLETRAAWTRVSLEGWIRAERTAAVARDASIVGSIFITDEKGHTAVGANLALRLVSDPHGAVAEIAAIRAECESTRASLKAEADLQKDKGERAMKTIENPSRAFEAYDEAKRQRAAKLHEMEALDDRCDARIERALEIRTAVRALANSDGRFIFESVPPGRYTLHASFDAEGVRHEWDVELTLAAGQRLALDLTNGNRTRSEPLPVYR